MKTRIAALIALLCCVFAFAVCAQTTANAKQDKVLKIKTDNQATATTPAKKLSTATPAQGAFDRMRAQMDQMQRQMNRFNNDPFFDSNFTSMPVLNPQFVVASNYPQVKFDKTDSDYIVQVITPGMDKKDLAISINDDLMTVSGKSNTETKKNDGKKTVYDSMSSTQFTRSFSLPNDINKDKITSKYENGVLTIKIPVDKAKAKEQTQTISID